MWRAGPSGVAHASYRASTTSLCGALLTGERDSYPVDRRCVGCTGIVAGEGTLDLALAEAERVIANAPITTPTPYHAVRRLKGAS